MLDVNQTMSDAIAKLPKLIVACSVIGLVGGVIGYGVLPWLQADVFYLPLHEIIPVEYHSAVDDSIVNSSLQTTQRWSVMLIVYSGVILFLSLAHLIALRRKSSA